MLPFNLNIRKKHTSKLCVAFTVQWFISWLNINFSSQILIAFVMLKFQCKISGIGHRDWPYLVCSVCCYTRINLSQDRRVSFVMTDLRNYSLHDYNNFAMRMCVRCVYIRVCHLYYGDDADTLMFIEIHTEYMPCPCPCRIIQSIQSRVRNDYFVQT